MTRLVRARWFTSAAAYRQYGATRDRLAEQRAYYAVPRPGRAFAFNPLCPECHEHRGSAVHRAHRRRPTHA